MVLMALVLRNRPHRKPARALRPCRARSPSPARGLLQCDEQPTARWTAQQIVDAFPDDSAPSYLLRDRDQVYGAPFRHQVNGLRIEEIHGAAQPLAESLRGATHRVDSARVSESRSGPR